MLVELCNFYFTLQINLYSTTRFISDRSELPTVVLIYHEMNFCFFWKSKDAINVDSQTIGPISNVRCKRGFSRGWKSQLPAISSGAFEKKKLWNDPYSVYTRENTTGLTFPLLRQVAARDDTIGLRFSTPSPSCGFAVHSPRVFFLSPVSPRPRHLDLTITSIYRRNHLEALVSSKYKVGLAVTTTASS